MPDLQRKNFLRAYFRHNTVHVNYISIKISINSREKEKSE